VNYETYILKGLAIESDPKICASVEFRNSDYIIEKQSKNA